MNTNAIEVMQNKGVKEFDTVTYEHGTGKRTCIVLKIKVGGVMLRTIDNKDKPFLAYGDMLQNISKVEK